jgi:hypothetical protein
MKPLASDLTHAQIESFWRRVKRADGCWLWTGARMSKGYGTVSFWKRHRLAHRIAWALTHGEPRPGLDICHTCDVRACCNPAHLFDGTRLDNVRDMLQKGRGRWVATKGEANGSAKLTEDAVLEIRATRGENKRLALKHGVGLTTIKAIRNRTAWAWLE